MPSRKNNAHGKGVLVIGGIIVDMIVRSPEHFRVENGKLCFPYDTKLQIKDFTFDIGGSAHNAAANLSNLGTKTYLFGCVGNEPYGEMALQNLKLYSVDTRFVKKVEGFTGISVVFITNGEKTILTYRGANDFLGKERFSPKILEKVGTVIITSLISPNNVRLMKKVVDEARKRKIQIIVNPSMSMVHHRPKELKYALRRGDVAIMNGKEAMMITGSKNVESALKELKKFGLKTVIVTQDVRGSIVVDGAEIFRVPSFKVKVADTTGGGDSFTAGFVHAKKKGLSTKEAVRFASAVAALNIFTPGASTDLPSERRVFSFMKKARYNR